MPAGRMTMALAVCLGAALALTACSDDKPEPTPTRTGATANPSASSSNSAWAPTPAWQQVGNFDAIPDHPRSALIKLYPLQRINGRLLLTADIVAQGTGSDLIGVNYFSRGQSDGTLDDVSLVDTTERVRYGPLKQTAAPGAARYSSDIRLSYLKVGATYRVGAFFPDPGPSVSTMGVDLQLAGMAPAVPIVDGGQTAPGLVTGSTAGSTGDSAPTGTVTVPGATTATGTTVPTTDAAATPGSGSAVQSTGVAAPSGGADNGPLTTWTVPAPGADAVVDRHDLVAKVVGGTVNEGGNRKQGVVSLNADVLFAFDSDKLSGRAGSLVGKARDILTQKADPSKPVSIDGYTDGKGSDGYNQSLSTRRANAVKKELGKVGSLQISSRGRGEDDPVAPNQKPDGSDNPKGRALNRRVEISYTPKPAPAPTTAAPAPTTSAPSTGAGVTLPAATVKSNGVNPAQVSATVQPITQDGTLSLVTLDITAEADTLVTDAFTGRSRANQDLGAFSIVDPATKAAYVPAYDSDDHDRLLTTYTHRLSAGQPQHLAFFAAALPDGTTSASVDLDQLGTAKNVPVVE